MVGRVKKEGTEIVAQKGVPDGHIGRAGDVDSEAGGIAYLAILDDQVLGGAGD